MKFNGHSSSFKLGATPVATLNYHCKIVMNQEDEFGDSSISLHVSRLIRTRVCEKKKKRESGCSCLQIPQDVILNGISTLWTTKDYFQDT